MKQNYSTELFCLIFNKIFHKIFGLCRYQRGLSLIQPVVPVVDRKVAADEHRVEGVREDQEAAVIPQQYPCDAGHVSEEDDEKEEEALALPRPARP